MTEASSHEVTELLIAWGKGDQSALEKLVPLIHAQLYRLAKTYMGRQSPDHPLQPTALVNEAYVRLIDWKNAKWKNRFARKRPHTKEGAARHVPLDEALVVAGKKTDDPFVDWNPVWSPNGKHLYFISNRRGVMGLWRVAIGERRRSSRRLS
jgi:ECF sigma factor/WD40-like Beta Propeller Repeat